jgi:uncharacterized protein YlzI (FlbEa/FlbD family)
MLELTAPDGSPTRIEATKIKRIRATIGIETDNGCQTLINAVDALVKDETSRVVSLARAELSTLIELRQLNDTPVWLNAMIIEGPLRLTRWEKQDGANSAVLLGGKRLYLLSTAPQVYDAIRAVGGKPSPIPAEDESLVSDLIGAARAWISGQSTLDR